MFLLWMFNDIIILFICRFYFYFVKMKLEIFYSDIFKSHYLIIEDIDDDSKSICVYKDNKLASNNVYKQFAGINLLEILNLKNFLIKKEINENNF